MKKNTNILISLLTCVLTIGAIGAIGYTVYKNNQTDDLIEKEIVNLSVNYFKDNKIDYSLTVVDEYEQGMIVDLYKYRINIPDYSFINFNVSGTTLKMVEDTSVNLYYEKSDDVLNYNLMVYVSDNNGEYQLFEETRLSVDRSFVSLDYLRLIYCVNNSNFINYELDIEKSSCNDSSGSLYFNRNNISTETKAYQVNLYYDYQDGEGYQLINNYDIETNSARATLEDIYLGCVLKDSSINSSGFIDKENSLITGSNCKLYISDPIVWTTYQCNFCNSHLTWNDSWGAYCNYFNCGGDGYYKSYKIKENPFTNVIFSTTLLVEKGDCSELTKDQIVG